MKTDPMNVMLRVRESPTAPSPRRWGLLTLRLASVVQMHREGRSKGKGKATGANAPPGAADGKRDAARINQRDEREERRGPGGLRLERVSLPNS